MRRGLPPDNRRSVFQPATFEVQALPNVGSTIPVRESSEQPTGLLWPQALKNDQSEKLVEGLSVASDCIEYRVGRSEKKDFWARNQRFAQRVNFPLVANLREYPVEILHKQEEPLAACTAIVHERCKRIGNEALAISLVLAERIGSVFPRL